MSKHTPGPWRVVKRANHTGLRMLAVDTNRDGHFDIPVTMNNAVENARLIAAAPELLEAAKSFRAFMLEFNGHECFAEINHPALTALDAAIAKAEGK